MIKYGISLATLCAAMLANEASAQETPSASPPAAAAQPAAERGLADIVVTAQRRSENLQRVPITVQAVTQQVLQENGVVNVATIQTVVPGVVVQRSFTGTNPFIRGVGTIAAGFTAEQPVATYIDGFYLANAASSIFSFNNIERIEVLKGPQGTLFGRNAAGGLIQVVTRDPSETPHVEGSIGYANYNTFDGSLYATTGLAENLAIDFAGLYHDQGDGWGRNTFTGKDIFKSREISASSKIKWTPTPDTTVTLRGLYFHSKGDIGAINGVYPGSVGTDGSTYLGKYTVAHRVDTQNLLEQENVGLKIAQELGFAQLVSLTSYNHVRNPLTGLAQNGILGQPVAGQSAVVINNIGRSDTFTQELQLLAPQGAPVQWIVGGFYMHDHWQLDNIIMPTCVNGVCARAPVPIVNHADQRLESYAGFGEVTVTIAETTRITGGLRYTRERKDISASYRAPLPGFPTSVAALAPPLRAGDPGTPNPRATFSKLTWRGVIAHDFSPHTMAYASANRGFKAGSFNPLTITNPPVRPEVLDAYEIGLKTALLDRRLRLNLSAFYYNHKDIQLRSPDPNNLGALFLRNAARGRIKGIDGDFIFAATPELQINGALTVLHAKFVDFNPAPCTRPAVINPPAVLGGVVSFNCSLTGVPLTRAPKFTGNIGFTYKKATAIGEFSLAANESYNSGFSWQEDDRIRQKPYHQVNASLTWTPEDKQFSVQVYGRNLNKPNYFVLGQEGASGTDVYVPGEPRTYGVKIGFNF